MRPACPSASECGDEFQSVEVLRPSPSDILTSAGRSTSCTTRSATAKIRTLTIFDDVTGECLAIEVDTSLPRIRVVRVLDAIGRVRGYPRSIIMDNGPSLRASPWLCGLVIGASRSTSSHPASQRRTHSSNRSTRDSEMNAKAKTSSRRSARPGDHRGLAIRLQQAAAASFSRQSYARGIRSQPRNDSSSTVTRGLTSDSRHDRPKRRRQVHIGLGNERYFRRSQIEATA